jgi:hypothetical protein
MNTHLEPYAWQKTWNNQTIWHHVVFKFFKEHENMWEARCALKVTIFPLVKVLPLSYGNNIFGVGENKKLY